MDYTYNSTGERETSALTVDGMVSAKWKYSDYATVGAPDSSSRSFHTLNKQALVNGNWVDSSEEFHYRFDSAGKLVNAAFAQTPMTGVTTAPFYTYNSAAASRAEAVYDYTPTGQLQDLQHSWQLENPNSVGPDMLQTSMERGHPCMT